MPSADTAVGTPAAPAYHPAPPHGPGLRLRLNVIVIVLMSLFLALLVTLKVQTTRASVHEEIVGSNRVASQLLDRVSWIIARGGPGAMLDFLQQLGRVRANEIRLMDAQGRELYHSPPSPYKQGRNAPAWFVELMMPPLPKTHQIQMPGATLTIEPNPSRAILDGWDDLLQLASSALVALILIHVAVFWAVGRTLQPFGQIVEGLARMRAGDYAHRLPVLPGREAALIGHAVNTLGEALEANVQQRIAAHESERTLATSRNWAAQVEQRLEAERREIASELHDELGQSVTAIRSLARSLSSRLAAEDRVGREAVGLIDSEAARLYDAMHGMIPRLTPLSLGPLGLPDALRDLCATLRRRHTGIEFTLQIDGPELPTAPDTALAAYRVAQEAVNNALKHSGASRIVLRLQRQAPNALVLTIEDNGCGLPPVAQRSVRFGLTGLGERVRGLGGRFEATPVATRGTLVRAELPCAATTDTTWETSMPLPDQERRT